MDASDRRKMAVNLRKWDESVPLHMVSPSYDVPSFLRGSTTLLPAEMEEMGSVRGRSLLHLQCHFGMDTLSWARQGARVTGVDFSPRAVRAARKLAREAALEARFVLSNVYDLPDVLDARFDRIYTGKGALWWLPDIERWAQVAAHFLKPDGKVLLFEDHPIAEVFSNDDDATELEPRELYFGTRARREEFDGTYATSKRMRNRVSYGWVHPVSQTLSALLKAGLVIESVREYPFSFWQRFRPMTEDSHGYWHLPTQEGIIPLTWSVVARQPLHPQSSQDPRAEGKSDRGGSQGSSGAPRSRSRFRT